MGTIKDKLIKEELAKPFEVGKTIRVKGKYLKFNTSQNPDWENVLTIKEVKEEDGKLSSMLRIQNIVLTLEVSNV